jgi:type IV pilus assembly protein PilE
MGGVMHKKTAGVTLVELMVTLAVLAILVSIGYPMYTDQVRKSRRVDARGGVMELAMAMDRHEGAFGRYTESATTIAGITFADGSPTPGLNATFDDDVTRIAAQYREFFNFTITADNDTYTITATPTGGQANDSDCASFSINQIGTKSALDSSTSDNTNLCW